MQFNIKTDKLGFTLIELLVVIAIIGLLSSMTTVIVNATRLEARDMKRVADAKQIIKALELYFDDYSTGPSEVRCDSSIGSCDTDCPCAPAFDDWDPGSGIVQGLTDEEFMAKLPKDPINNSDYYYAYEYCDNSRDFFIRVRLEKTKGYYYVSSSGDTCSHADFDRNGVINTGDLSLFAADYGRLNCADCIYDCFGDFDCDGDVDENDFHFFEKCFGQWPGCYP